MRVAKIIKTQALFVGAVIGAGFATGKELVTFYGEYALFSIFFSGILLGLLSSLFMYFGKYNCGNILPKFVKKCVDWASVLAVVMSFVTMCAGMQELADSFSGGVELALICTLVVLIGISKTNLIDWLNNFVVVAIVATLLFFLPKAKFEWGGGIDFCRSVGYCGLNIMLGGMAIEQEGQDMRDVDILIVGMTSGVILSVMMSIAYSLSIEHFWASMPMLIFGKIYGYEKLVVTLIGFAIFTTMIACARTLYAKNSIHIAQNDIFAIFLIGLCIVGKSLPFDICVRYFYGFVGAVGVVYLCIVLWCVIFWAVRSKIKSKIK